MQNPRPSFCQPVRASVKGYDMMNGGENEMERYIMLVLGIFVLCSFYTFSVISFLKHRLPKKQNEYRRIRKILGKEK
jgi:sorbitol-specific phosphotransferase system component IIC